MIYQSYNFVDSYSNASGNRKHSMVLGELGKVINKEPKAVIDALKDAGIKVPVNASRRDLVRLIIANKRNKRLIQNLSVLITASATTLESYSNMMDDDKLAPLPATAGGKLTSTSSQKELAGTKKGGFLQSIGQFFQKRKQGKDLDPTKKGTAEEESGFQRFAKWFTKNRDTIGQVANTLNNSLGSANAGNIPTGDGGDGGNDAPTGTWIQRNKTLVIVGLVVVAGGVYFLSKRKGNK